MSLRREMLQFARLAPRFLGDSTALVQSFLCAAQHPEGGFLDRSGRPDLYYTVFGLESMLVLDVAIPLKPTVHFLLNHGAGRDLDFVHLCCLARCWANVSEAGAGDALQIHLRQAIASNLARFRSQDGGFHPNPAAKRGTTYGGFLGLGAFQDLDHPLPNPNSLRDSLGEIMLEDGGWPNDPAANAAATNTTAAAVSALRHLRQTVSPATLSWLKARFLPAGGCVAGPFTPLPDLLSTATALHALALAGEPLDPLRESCLDFIDSLWTNAGGFHGHWADDHLDCEYTFYGLLALGHLANAAIS